jgi:hypothetical protein
MTVAVRKTWLPEWQTHGFKCLQIEPVAIVVSVTTDDQEYQQGG